MNPSIISIARPWVVCTYWSIASVLSVYYGVRAIFIQRRLVGDENAEREKRGLVPWSLRETIFIHRVQSFVYNFVGAMIGFVSLHLEYGIILSISDLANIQSGTALLLSFLSLIAIVGISGQLPEILLHGKLFGGK